MSTFKSQHFYKPKAELPYIKNSVEMVMYIMSYLPTQWNSISRFKKMKSLWEHGKCASFSVKVKITPQNRVDSNMLKCACEKDRRGHKSENNDAKGLKVTATFFFFYASDFFVISFYNLKENLKHKFSDSRLSTASNEKASFTLLPSSPAVYRELIWY